MTFEKDESTGLWKSTDCGTAGTLQVQLKKEGIITISTGLEDFSQVLVDRYKGVNLLRQMNLPEACKVTVLSTEEVQAAEFTES